MSISKNTWCCGCRACVEICPKKAINMQQDKESFLYPTIISDLCIDCGLCERVCPSFYNDYRSIEDSTAYCCIHKDKDIAFNSSSGGAFAAICKAFIDTDYSICGVRFNDNLQVVHDFADSLSECEVFKKSKYVQSNTNGCYEKVAQRMSEGKSVLFSGVSCQIAGLLLFLRTKRVDTANLVTVNLLCHGVPSQELFNAYIEEEEEEEASAIFQFRFKNKNADNGVVNSRTGYISFDNGHSYIRNSDNDPFLRGYYNRLFLRPSCGTCKFAREGRFTDFTIADAWHVENIYPDLKPLEGVSLLLCNTEKGREFLPSILDEMQYRELSIDWVRNSQDVFKQPTEMNRNREKFFDLWTRMSFKKAVFKCIPVPIKKKIIVTVSPRIPKGIKETIKRLKK